MTPLGSPTCAGLGQQPPHGARWVDRDGLCPSCVNRRDSESEKAEMGKYAGMDDDERAWRTSA